MHTSTAARSSRSDADIAMRLVRRWPAARGFVVLGATSIVAGGFVAAVARPAGFDLGPWLAAFLVLVGGVAQIALGTVQAWLAGGPPPTTEVRAELVVWNLALVVTIVGSLVAVPALTVVGRRCWSRR